MLSSWNFHVGASATLTKLLTLENSFKGCKERKEPKCRTKTDKNKVFHCSRGGSYITLEKDGVKK